MSRAGRPFIKWAGGKGQLLGAIGEAIPARMKRYYEPFLGGGAVFFAMAAEERFESATLNDCNTDLVELYKTVRDSPDELIAALRGHMTHDWNTVEYFKSVRELDPASLEPTARAARLIYLNKTCFNGLYRVNKRGTFNVPFGRYKNPSLFDEVNVRTCSQMLRKNVKILNLDFAATVGEAQAGDVVYFDPPYVPLSETSNFASYTAGGFSASDHHRLAIVCRDLVERGVTVIQSNSDMSLVRTLYKDGFEILSVMANRHINSKPDRRGPIGEVLIVHYAPGHSRVRSFHETIEMPSEETDEQA